MVCPNCKREADEGNRFCKYCGYSFSDNVLSSNNNVASVNKSSEDKAPAKKSNTVAIVLTILAAGVLLSAGIIFIGYNMIKGRSLEKYAEEKIIDDDDDKDVKVSKKKKKKKAKETKEEADEEETVVKESESEAVKESTYETYSYEETMMAQEPIYTTLYVVNCDKSISLRNAPSTKATSIRQIPLGAAVSFVQNSTDGFYQISYMGDTGYALASYLSSNPASSYRQSETYSAYNGYYDYDYYEYDDIFYGYVVDCKESITLREAPSTSAKEIIQIPLNSVLLVYGYTDSDFFYVSYGDYYGYVLASYVEIY